MTFREVLITITKTASETVRSLYATYKMHT